PRLRSPVSQQFVVEQATQRSQAPVMLTDTPLAMVSDPFPTRLASDLQSTVPVAEVVIDAPLVMFTVPPLMVRWSTVTPAAETLSCEPLTSKVPRPTSVAPAPSA